jgi:hypothetical protein
MDKEELQSKLDDLTRSLDELCEMLGISKDMIPDTDDEDYDEEDEDYEDEDYEDEDFDDDGSGAVGVGMGFRLPSFEEYAEGLSEHILSEPDEDGMVEISDELYEKLFGKYKSKEDMLSDLIDQFDFYITGKNVGYAGYWDYVYHLGINKRNHKPSIQKDEELGDDYDLYDLSEFDQCFWTNIDDIEADIFEYKLINDKPLRDLVDKYYPDLEW